MMGVGLLNPGGTSDGGSAALASAQAEPPQAVTGMATGLATVQSAAAAVAAAAAFGDQARDAGGRDTGATWAHVISAYLEPWLVRQLDAAARAAAVRPGAAARRMTRAAAARAARENEGGTNGRDGAPCVKGASLGNLAWSDEGEEEEEEGEEDYDVLDTQPQPASSRLSMLLAALLPPEEIEACALRLLAHGVTVRDVQARAWPRGSTRPSPAGLHLILRLAGYAVGRRQRIVSRMHMGPPPPLPRPRKPRPRPPPVPTVPPAPNPLLKPPPPPRPVQAVNPSSPGFVDFRVSVTNPHHIDADAFLIVQSALRNWGTQGWTATLRPTDRASELRWRPSGAGGTGPGPGPLRRAPTGDVGAGAGAGDGEGSSSRLFVGSWGGHVPDFARQPVPCGLHKFVLAISGKADDYGGWARALHKEAGIPDGSVWVRPGETSVVELRLTIGENHSADVPTRIEG